MLHLIHFYFICREHIHFFYIHWLLSSMCTILFSQFVPIFFFSFHLFSFIAMFLTLQLSVTSTNDIDAHISHFFFFFIILFSMEQNKLKEPECERIKWSSKAKNKMKKKKKKLWWIKTYFPLNRRSVSFVVWITTLCIYSTAMQSRILAFLLPNRARMYRQAIRTLNLLHISREGNNISFPILPIIKQLGKKEKSV